MKKSFGLLVVLLLSFWAFKPLLLPGWIPVHDQTQVVRIQQMAQALSEGQFPVRWVKDLGYGFGYPLFNFYAPLPYYVGALFNLLSFDSLVATKLMFILGILLAGGTMYFWARGVWGETGGVLASLFYLYAPYRAVDIYVRGAVGELWAMAFLPLVFLGLSKIAKTKGQKLLSRGVVIGSLGYAGVILSHNLTAMMAVPFILLMGLILFVASKKKQQFVLSGLLLILFALGLAASYWLPALAEMRLTKVFGQVGGGADWRDHFVFFDQLWASPWGFGGSAPGRLDGMSFMIGKLHFLLAGLSGLILLWAWKMKRRKVLTPLLIGWVFFSAAIFFTQRLSWPIWQWVTPLAFVQYPWRFLIFATLAASFLIGSLALWLRPGSRRDWLGAGILLLLLVFNTKYFQPQRFLPITSQDLLTEKKIKWTTSKISDEYLPIGFPVPQSKEEVAWEKVMVTQGVAEIKDLVVRSNKIVFSLKAKKEGQALINLASFPGWQVLVDEKKTDPVIEEGKISLPFSPGEHQVEISFNNTTLRRLADLISLISFLGLIYLFRRQKSIG